MSENELHLDEFNIISKEEVDNNTLLYNVEPAYTVISCPYCNGNVVKHGMIDRLMRDLPSFGKNVWIRVLYNRYKCKSCKKTHTQPLLSIADKAKITTRLKQKIENDSLRLSATEIANQYGLSVTCVSNICMEYIDKLDSQRILYSPRVLGIDEAHLNKTMRCVLVDVEEHGIIDILINRNISTVEEYLDNLPDNNNIEVVTMDMWKGYKSAVENCLPYAKIVIDKFHVIKEVIAAMEAERKKYQIICKIKKSVLN